MTTNAQTNAIPTASPDQKKVFFVLSLVFLVLSAVFGYLWLGSEMPAQLTNCVKKGVHVHPALRSYTCEPSGRSLSESMDHLSAALRSSMLAALALSSLMFSLAWFAFVIRKK